MKKMINKKVVIKEVKDFGLGAYFSGLFIGASIPLIFVIGVVGKLPLIVTSIASLGFILITFSLKSKVLTNLDEIK